MLTIDSSPLLLDSDASPTEHSLVRPHHERMEGQPAKVPCCAKCNHPTCTGRLKSSDSKWYYQECTSNEWKELTSNTLELEVTDEDPAGQKYDLVIHNGNERNISVTVTGEGIDHPEKTILHNSSRTWRCLCTASSCSWTIRGYVLDPTGASRFKHPHTEQPLPDPTFKIIKAG